MTECIDVICQACSSTNTIQVIHSTPQAGVIIDRVCQVIIAAFAAIGTVVGLFKCRIDKKLNAPELAVHFLDEQPYCEIEEMSASGGTDGIRGGNKKILLKVGVENVGPHLAKGCSIKLLSVSMADNNKELHLTVTNLRKDLKKIGKAEEGDSVQSGGMCLFELGEISVDKKEESSGRPTDSTNASEACLELHCSDGTIERLRSHQSHVNIIINLCADDFTPRKYLLHIDWKGKSVADIGTEGAFECSASSLKK